jgi:hypothetical protein
MTREVNGHTIPFFLQSCLNLYLWASAAMPTSLLSRLEQMSARFAKVLL